MKGWLTVSVSGRFFSFSRPRPVSSRLTEATAFMLTMVERWICLKVVASSESSSSRSGVRSSDSP